MLLPKEQSSQPAQPRVGETDGTVALVERFSGTYGLGYATAGGEPFTFAHRRSR